MTGRRARGARDAVGLVTGRGLRELLRRDCVAGVDPTPVEVIDQGLKAALARGWDERRPRRPGTICPPVAPRSSARGPWPVPAVADRARLGPRARRSGTRCGSRTRSPTAIFRGSRRQRFPGTQGSSPGRARRGADVAAFSGRCPLYEGHGSDVPACCHVWPTRSAPDDGADRRGRRARRPSVAAGTVVIVRDHLNLMGAAPLPRVAVSGRDAGVRQPQEVYDRAIADLAVERADALGIRAAHGVYAAMSGPAYESPAEVAMLRASGRDRGGDVDGPGEPSPRMALGMRVLGICSLTNAFGEHVTHEEVVRVSSETAAGRREAPRGPVAPPPGPKAGT